MKVDYTTKVQRIAAVLSESSERVKQEAVLAERERCAADLLDCQELLHELIKQSIGTDKGTYFSGFIGIHADVLRYLCRAGLMRPCKGYEDRLEPLDRDFEATDVIK